jgi:transposase IS4-like protein/DDE family transposase
MPHAGQIKPPVIPRLSDRIAMGVLTRTFPPELVDRVIAKCGRAERRQRLLPARVVIYYILAMCLFAQVGYEEVMRLLVEGLAWMRRWQGSWQVPDKSSIVRARQRLGSGPLRELFVEVARPLATHATKGAWCRGLRLMALDGTTFDVPDTPANVAAFGRPGGGRGQGAFPQVRLVGLVECGTHAIVDAAVGGLHLGEGSLAPSLARSLGPGMVLLVDQGLCGLELWRTLRATGVELVWRCRQDVQLEVLEVFADGSWRSELGQSRPKHKRSRFGSWTTAWTIPAALASPRTTD